MKDELLQEFPAELLLPHVLVASQQLTDLWLQTQGQKKRNAEIMAERQAKEAAEDIVEMKNEL